MRSRRALAIRRANANGLVGHWPMDDGDASANDASGNGYRGTPIGAPFAVGGVVQGSDLDAGALEFDGASSYMDCGAAPLCNVGAGNPVSVSFWVNMASVPATALVTFVSFNNPAGGGSQNNYFFRYNAVPGKFDWGAYNGTYDAVQWTAAGFSAGQWAHCCGTFDGAAWTIYFNGLSKAATSSAIATQGFAGHLYFGGENDGGAQRGFVPGAMDDVRVYNRALSPGEVSALYADGLSALRSEEEWPALPFSAFVVGNLLRSQAPRARSLAAATASVRALRSNWTR